MKKLLFVVYLSFISTMLFAQNDSTTGDSTSNHLSKTVDSSNLAKIYVIRSTGYAGSAVNLRVIVDDVMLCKVRNDRYAMFYIQPGTHMFYATTWDKPGTNPKFALKMPVEAGKTYYMSMKLKQKFMGIEITLEEITYNTAAGLLEKYKRDECD